MKTTDSPINFSDFDVLSAVPVPMMGDRQVRLRTLEEAIEDLMSAREQVSGEMAARDGIRGYFIQIKPKADPTRSKPASLTAPEAAPPSSAPSNGQNAVKSTADGIYLADGSLNLEQLLKSAQVLFDSGDYALARKIYRAIMKTGEKPWLATREMGRCFEAENKLEEARALYEESIAFQPLADTFKLLASVLIRLQKDEEAAEILDRALMLRDLGAPERFDFHQTAGNCWARLRNRAESERHYLKALELKPEADAIHCGLGAVYLQQGLCDEAEKQFETALKINPKNHAALSGLGSCALADGNKIAAHDYFARALKIEIVNPTALFHLVKCAYEIKSYPVAAMILEEYVQLAPVNAHLLYSLAGLQYHLGRLDDSAATCRKISEIMPEHAGARELMNRIAT